METCITSGGRSLNAASISPSIGTGHSTSPETSSSRASSGTTEKPRSAASRAIPSAMIARRSAASAITKRVRSASCQSSTDATATAPGARKRCPSVRSDEASPWPSSSPSRRSNATTARSSRQTMRRSGRTQVNWLVPPQRIDFGHGKRRSNVGIVCAIRRVAGIAGADFSSTQKSPSRRRSSRAALCLRRKPAIAGSGALARGPRSVLRRAATPASTSAASAIRRGPEKRAQPARRKHRRSLAEQARKVLRRARLHPCWDFLREEFEEERRHGQPLRAGSMSVCAKYSVLARVQYPPANRSTFRPLPPTPSRKGRGSSAHKPPPLAGGGGGEGCHRHRKGSHELPPI